MHSFNHIESSSKALGLFDGDNSVFADLFHSLCDESANIFVRRGNRRNLGDGLFCFNRLCDLADFFNGYINSALNTLFQFHRVCACRNILEAFLNDDLSKKRCRSGSISCNIVCLGSDFFNNLRTHVFGSVLKLDFPCDGNAVVCDKR